MSDVHCATTLVIARHGDTDYVEDCFSDEGGWLNADGLAQSRALAESLTGHRIARVWASDTSRAAQTAQIVADLLGVQVLTRRALREIGIGDLLGRPFSTAAIDAVVDRWTAGDLEARFPGGESGGEVVARYRDVLDEIADLHRGETVLVVAHQMATRVAVPALAANLTASYAATHELGNGESLELHLDDDGGRVTRWGAEMLPE